MCAGKFDSPQGLKPNAFDARNGTAEAVPFQIEFMKPVLRVSRQTSLRNIYAMRVPDLGLPERQQFVGSTCVRGAPPSRGVQLRAKLTYE